MDTKHLTPRELVRGGLLAGALWIAYLVGTGYVSAATLLDRVASTDVMKAASNGAWNAVVAGQIAIFFAALLFLHLFFAAINLVLAAATTTLLPATRAKFGRVVLAWFALMAASVLIFSALWFPRTLFGAYYHDTLAHPVGSWPIGQILYISVVVAASSTLLLAAARTTPRVFQTGSRRAGAVAALFLVVVLALVNSSLRFPGAHASTADSARPNVIILGIDSLRLEQLRRFGGTGVTPNLDAFLARADVIKDTTTPAARTFSSWVAILTGRAPTVTGARFNLAERSSVRANPTVADVLRKAGYHTVYSTDEVRFANIDQSFGFDQVVTPRIGASDFLVGSYNELPLSSVVINTRLGKLLFPFSYANRGVATMFEPETFVQRLDREVNFDGPTLFICHLTAAHWPYYTADTPFGVSKPASPQDRPMYRIGLQTADRMFGELVQVLKSKGALENALVIVLSDHGEAMGLPSDSFFDSTFHVEGLKAPLKMEDHGHGQSVLSQTQYHVLLGFRQFGRRPDFGFEGRTLGTLATVEDIAPTILDWLKWDATELAPEGQSLLPELRGRGSNGDGSPRIRFTETDLRVLPGPGGGVDEAGTAKRNAVFFVVDPKDARLHIREAYRPLALAYKERAAFTDRQLLAAMPAGPYAHQYIYVDLAADRGRLLMKRPDDTEPAARRLWDALHEHYAGELHQPVATTPADWPRIADEWTQFSTALVRHDDARKPAGG
jgi:hypothetical protein